MEGCGYESWELTPSSDGLEECPSSQLGMQAAANSGNQCGEEGGGAEAETNTNKCGSVCPRGHSLHFRQPCRVGPDGAVNGR